MAANPPGPPGQRSGPRSETEGRPEIKALAKATGTSPGEEVMPSLLIVRHDRDSRQSLARRLPLAFASEAAPCDKRTQWAVMYQCGACGGTHFGRSRTEMTTGKRRARCGRVVWLVIARVYRGRPDSGTAA
jgi:hypothetical protein